MPKKTKKAEEKVVERIVARQDVVSMLEGHNFKRNDLPEEKIKLYEGYQATYDVKIINDTEQSHILICSIFDDAFRFAVMDEVGIIKLVSFQNDTPTDVLEKYIGKCADFFLI